MILVNKKYMDFEEKLKYVFKEKELLILALTHASIGNEKKEKSVQNNQRLEFLGDAILDAVISKELYELLPEAKEGDLTRMRANIVCQNALVNVGKNMQIGTYLELTKGEENSGGREKKAIIADAVEAVIGAVYLDSSFEEARERILDLFREEIKKTIIKKDEIRDYKSKLQEEIQGKTVYGVHLFSNPLSTDQIRYEVIKEKGPAHNKSFAVQLTIGGVIAGIGEGKNKKEAEQKAAKAALEERN